MVYYSLCDMYHIVKRGNWEYELYLGCFPRNPTEISESCDFTGVPPTAPVLPTHTTVPTHSCPANEIPVECDACNEAFCCDSGRVLSLRYMTAFPLL